MYSKHSSLIHKGKRRIIAIWKENKIDKIAFLQLQYPLQRKLRIKITLKKKLEVRIDHILSMKKKVYKC